MNYLTTILLVLTMLVYCNPAHAETSFEQKYGDRLVSFLQEDSELPHPSKITLAQYIECFESLAFRKANTMTGLVENPEQILDGANYTAAAMRDIDAHTAVFKIETYGMALDCTSIVETIFVAQNDTQHVLITKIFDQLVGMRVFQDRQELHGQARENTLIRFLKIAEKEMLR